MNKSLLVIFALVVACSALKTKKITNKQFDRVQEIKKGNSWGSILLNLAELHTLAKGPIDELVAAIEDTINDLAFKREKTEEAFVKRTDEHNAMVTKLEADIANTETDIENILGVLDMLAEQKASLEEENKRLLQDNVNTRAQMREATSVREKQHEEFVTKVEETEEAVAMVEECLQILNDFATGGAEFVQVKKVRTILAETTKRVQKLNSVEGAFLNALVQVANKQEFADSSAINAVIGKFNEIKNNFLDSIGKLNADESLAQQEFEKFISDSKAEISENESIVAYNVGLLEENAINTEENTNLLAQRRADLAAFKQALEDEHVSYDAYVERYTRWCEENDRETAVCKEALEVVATIDMPDYMSDRIDAKDGLVSSGMAGDKQHGMGTEVFNFDAGI